MDEGELRAGLAALGLTFEDAQVERLIQYGQLLLKWTQVYNLTAVRRPEEILTHHILDSGAIVPPLRRFGKGGALRLLDVGSGGGLPGAVIAIACPEIQVDCVDAVAKKAAFIQQVAAALKLSNLRGLHSRVEQLNGSYDVITSRAFSSLAEFTRLSAAALGPEGVWLGMKGRYPADEVSQLPAGVELFHVEQLQVPDLDAERCLLWLRRRAA